MGGPATASNDAPHAPPASSSSSSTWADTPYRLIAETGKLKRNDIPSGHCCTEVALEMALVHNVILRAFNSIYNQAPHVPPSRQRAFLTYNDVAFHFLQHHHKTEETDFFVKIEQITPSMKGFWDRALEQHHAFEQGAKVYKDWLDAVRRGEAEYDGKHLQSLIDGFMPTLHQHLFDEIEMLINLSVLDSQELHNFFEAFKKRAIAGVDPFRECPLVMGCQDSSFKVDGREELINAPLLLRVATNWVFCWKHRDVWQFLPSSYTAKKRPLAYASATPATAVQAAA